MKSSIAPATASTRADESYGAFAYAYDKALGQRFFGSIRKLLEHALDKYPATVKTHLDVACGTGLTAQFFAMRGWRTTGADASLPMLSIARTRASRLVAADFRELPFRGKFARVTCLYDSLNHLRDRAELTAAFRAVRRVVADDGLFLFDMNHPDIYPEVWGMKQPYVATGKEFHLEIATKFDKRARMGQALVTGWALDVRGERMTIHETHRQRAYTEREIVESLRDAGLAPREVIDFDPYDEAGSVDAEGVKLFFIAAPV